MDELIKEWDEKTSIGKLLTDLGEDLTREGLQETPDRVHRAWREFLDGYTLTPTEAMGTYFDAEGHDVQICSNIHFTSLCEHHLLVFTGYCHIAYIPDQYVVGLSKLARLVDCFAHRLQIQERMVQQIADALIEHTGAHGVYVVANAKHMCCHGRGIRRDKMDFITTATEGDVPEYIREALLANTLYRG